ncbi:MAG TPA: alkaline phosphatase D family protein, partial [Polyangia bacterium]|nr:alkaline phosphatase D family protein [Polyangia bacterium]
SASDARNNLVSVGTVDHRSVRLWFRAERPGRYVVSIRGADLAPHGRAVIDIAPGNPTDNTAAFTYPDQAPGAPPLSSLHRYTFRVVSEDETLVVGEGAFETAPATPDDTPSIFTVGLISCHQPFDVNGVLSPDSMRLCQQLFSTFASADTKFLLTVGDQIYADEPGNVSLLNAAYTSRWGRGPIQEWTPQQIREAYQERYRIFWNQTPWLKLLSSLPNYAMLDDHEVFDDWGSRPEHVHDPAAKIIAAARLAYLDYQGSRQLPWGPTATAPAAFDYGFRYGTLATFAFDIRSERWVGPPSRVFSPDQLGRFRAFLAENADAHVVFVVTSVPFVHLPEWVTARGAQIFATDVDFPDHWSAERNRADRGAVLDVIDAHLTAHPKQRLIVLGGDVHVGCAFSLHFVGDRKPRFYELTSSSVTNKLGCVQAAFTPVGPLAFEEWPALANGRVKASLLPAASDAPAMNPTGGLNAGLIELKRNGDETNVRLKLLGVGADGHAREEYVSGWL